MLGVQDFERKTKTKPTLPHQPFTLTPLTSPLTPSQKSCFFYWECNSKDCYLSRFGVTDSFTLRFRVSSHTA